MFQFPGFASTPYEFRCRSPCGGVSPFGHPRINDRSHLPAAFRSVPRPSSPLGAKASTERSYRAQHTTQARTQDQAPHTSISGSHLCPATQTLTSNQPIRFTCQTACHRPNPRSRDRSGQQPSRWGSAPSRATNFLETVGFEPTPPCLQSRCSPTELRPRKQKQDLPALAAPHDKVVRIAPSPSGGYFAPPARNHGPGRT